MTTLNNDKDLRECLVAYDSIFADLKLLYFNLKLNLSRKTDTVIKCIAPMKIRNLSNNKENLVCINGTAENKTKIYLFFIKLVTMSTSLPLNLEDGFKKLLDSIEKDLANAEFDEQYGDKEKRNSFSTRVDYVPYYDASKLTLIIFNLCKSNINHILMSVTDDELCVDTWYFRYNIDWSRHVAAQNI